jgi:hypothetical protein
VQNLIDLARHSLIAWIAALEQTWQFVGAAFALASWLAWLFRRGAFAQPFLLAALVLAVFQPGLYLLLPEVSPILWRQGYQLPRLHLWAFGVGAAVTTLSILLFARYCGAVWDWIAFRLTRRTSLQRHQRTDIRSIADHLPRAQGRYNPSRFFSHRRGVFLGLDEAARPVYIALEARRRKHVQVIGTTGSGKGVIAQVLLSQSIARGDSVVTIDPKNDEWLPHVLYRAAIDTGVPFVHIDLTGTHSQWNPLLNKSSFEIEELLNAAFGLGERGEAADFYRLRDRRASRMFAGSQGAAELKLSETLSRFLDANPGAQETAEKFLSDLEEIALMPVVATSVGHDFARLIEQGAVIYVRGSMRNPRVLKLQKMLLISIMQSIERRGRDGARHVCLFLDEFKYLVSRTALELLGAIRDKRAHAVIAHQSIGDLRDCPADVDPESVVSSVNENCAIKIAYAVRDPDTADWLSRMSGHILVDDEIRKVGTNIGFAERRENSRSLRQAERAFVDTNMLISLPDRCAVIFGLKTAKFAFTSPLRIEKDPEALLPTVPSPATAQGPDPQSDGSTNSKPFGHSISGAAIDVD